MCSVFCWVYGGIQKLFYGCACMENKKSIKGLTAESISGKLEGRKVM